MMTNFPKVSVLMPVYNADKYLEKAVESILNQTFENFEFIIINDDTAEKTRNCLNIYSDLDKRIKVYHQERKGLVSSLNLGITLAQGEFIARMDADDISYPDRLEKQINFMELNPSCSVVAAHVELIDESGEKRGHWDADVGTKTEKEIRKKLVKENCLAHPTVMVRNSLIREYYYDPDQKDSEDYDLWLRMVANGHKICKIPEILLKYRVHTKSVTYESNQKNPFIKTIKIRVRYVKKQITTLKFSFFMMSVLFFLILDILKLPYVFCNKILKDHK
jgi:glycosyltransferase involved in cell wall biosynthesis